MKITKLSYKQLLITTLIALGLVFSAVSVQAQTDDTPVETENPENSEESIDADPEAETTDDPTETNTSEDEEDITETDDEPVLLYEEVEVEEEVVTGEIIEVGDDYIVVEMTDGETRTISTGGSLLAPFVRAEETDDLAVGDMVEITLATEVSLEGEVAGVSADGTLTVTTIDGETRTIVPTATEVQVRRNGQIVTDFSTLTAGDEVELVYSGELISDVDAADEDAAGGWVVPVVIILIVLALAGLLAKRKKTY